MRARGFGGIVASWVLSASVFSVAGCAPEQERSNGELVLVLNTDMNIPKDISEVGIHIDVDGRVVWDRAYPVGPEPGKAKIPATLGILPGSSPEASVHIKIWARQGDEIRIVRDAVTTIPEERTAMLRMPLQWLCDGTAVEKNDDIESTCGQRKTCSAGKCVSIHIDSSQLPDFDAGEVFGGGRQDDGGAVVDGRCFDTLACFASGQPLPVEYSSCSVSVPEGLDSANFGLVFPPGGPGVCGADACIVPLDYDTQTGWTDQGAGVARLPQAVCDKVRAGEVLGVIVTSSCERKTPRLPMCGPWSSVGADAGTFGDVHVPFDASAQDADAAIDAADASDAAVDALDASDAADAADASDGDVPDAADSGTEPCNATGNAAQGKGGLCLHFDDYEAAQLLPDNSWSDGKGSLWVVLRSDDEPDFNKFSPEVICSYDSSVLGGQVDIGHLPVVRFTDVPTTIYVFAIFDDRDEGDLSSNPPRPPRGPIWMGGMDFTNGTRKGRLQKVEIKPGVGNNVSIHLVAGRSVSVPVKITSGVIVAPFNGQGFLSWKAYKTDVVHHDTPEWGFGFVEGCASLTPGVTVEVPGLLFGGGNTDYTFIASLDDAAGKPPTEDDDLWSHPGMVVSGESDGQGGWKPRTDERFHAGNQIDYGTVGSLLVLSTSVSGPDIGEKTCDGPPDGGTDGGQPCNEGAACSTGLMGECAQGHISCSSGYPECIPNNSASPEVCNGMDEDCDGAPDDFASWQPCKISGQLGVCAEGFLVCNGHSGMQCVPLHSAYPHDIPQNGLDDDCDGATDTCSLSHATTSLRPDGTCEIVSCESGYYDIDGRPDDGCEYDCTPTKRTDPTDPTTLVTCDPATDQDCGKQEYCDGLDNDCDGKVDDVDPNAACDPTASLNVQQWACEFGSCQVRICVQGYVELDGDPSNGCEAPAQQCSSQSETCDGVDNDCNGIVDDVNIATIPCWDLPGQTCSDPITGLSWDSPPGASCNGMGNLKGDCRVGHIKCVGGQWACVDSFAGQREMCDGRDNDCDGVTDEYDAEEGTDDCGMFFDGTWWCNSNSGKFECSNASVPAQETCNGQDDDGNGMTDDVPQAGLPCGESKGVCVPGYWKCRFENGTWSLVCEGAIQGPGYEIPGNGLDDDCDGLVDE